MPDTAVQRSAVSPSPSMTRDDASLPETAIRTVSDGPRQSVVSTSSLSGLSSDEAAGAGNASKRKGSGTKRPSSAVDESKGAKKAKVDESAKERGIYCHQCRTKCEPGNVLRCTRLKTFSKNQPPRACNLAFCDRDLKKRYDVQPENVRSGKGQQTVSGATPSKLKAVDLAADAKYNFECPCCKNECQASSCRKKKGLEPLGYNTTLKNGNSTDADTSTSAKSTKPAPKSTTAKTGEKATPAKSANGTPAKSASTKATNPTESPGVATPIRTDGPRPLPSSKAKTVQTKLVDSSTFNAAGSDSELSELDDSGVAVKSKPQAKSKKTSAHAGEKGKKTVKPANGQPSKAKTTEDATEKRVNAKGKGQKGAKTKAKPKAKKPVKEAKERTEKEKEQDMCDMLKKDPPPLPKANTKLSYVDVEQRIALREFLIRFRAVLSIPERSLSVLDDFDRPLTDASVRVFAGSILEVLRDDEEEAGGIDHDLHEDLLNFREELRYYADLARFASIFNALKDSLQLEVPPLTPAFSRPGLQSAVTNESSPDWATDSGPSRRKASRIPQPHEIVQMLLALAERVSMTWRCRGEMDSTSIEADARAVYFKENKKETAAWEPVRKRLAEERVRCKTPAATKACKAKYDKAYEEHCVCTRTLTANLSIATARQSPRAQPLGIDLDSRVYWRLIPRPIDNDVRSISGWQTGVFIYGPAIPGFIHPDDDLPAEADRWSHLKDSKAVDALGWWLFWRQHVKIMELGEAEAASTSASASKATPKKTPSKRKSQLEVVIPSSKRKAVSSESSLSTISSGRSRSKHREVDSDSDSSDLSDVSEDFKEELLGHINPPAYVASKDHFKDESMRLVQALWESAVYMGLMEGRGLVK